MRAAIARITYVRRRDLFSPRISPYRVCHSLTRDLIKRHVRRTKKLRTRNWSARELASRENSRPGVLIAPRANGKSSSSYFRERGRGRLLAADLNRGNASRLRWPSPRKRSVTHWMSAGMKEGLMDRGASLGARPNKKGGKRRECNTPCEERGLERGRIMRSSCRG